MTHVTRCIVSTAAILALYQLPAPAQEREVRDAISKLEEYRTGVKPVDAAAKELIEKVAKYYAARLNDAGVQKEGMAALVTDCERRFTFPRYPSDYEKTVSPAGRRTYNEELGRALAAALEPVVLENTKPIVRMNAARMLADSAARAGADATAEVFLKCLASPKESDAVKIWCLRGLGALFAIVPEANLPLKTVFQKANAEELPPLEQKCVQALIDFVNRKNEVKPEMLPEEVDAIRYVRREAIIALGLVRRQVVKHQRQVVARPALVLLKAAVRDGFTPPIDIDEQVEAIAGFCKLFPDRERELQLDYAVANVGAALIDVGQYHILRQGDPAVQWKVTAVKLRDALEFWQKNNEDLKIANAARIGQLALNVNDNILKQLELTAAGNAQVALPPVRAFLANTIKLAPDASLFKDDKSTTVKPMPWQQ